MRVAESVISLDFRERKAPHRCFIFGDRDKPTLNKSRSAQDPTLYLVHSRRSQRAETGGQRAPTLHSQIFLLDYQNWDNYARIPYTIIIIIILYYSLLSSIILYYPPLNK
jgi:hypothetical protein